MQKQTGTEATKQITDQINEALNRHDIDAIMSLMTDDIVFQNTSPAPDGTRHSGQREVRGFFEKLFSDSPQATFEIEDLFAVGDRCAVAWHYTWNLQGGNGSDPGRVHGVSLYRLRDGKVAETSAYVKG